MAIDHTNGGVVGAAAGDPLELVRDPSAKHREAALEQLRDDARAEALDAVVRCLHDDANDNVRRTAASVLGTMGTGAVGDLAKCLQNEEEKGFVRQEAARALGELRSDVSAAALATLAANSSDDKLREACVSALRAIASPEAATQLAGVAATLSPSYVRALAITVLGELGGKEAESAIEASAKDDDDRVKRAAASSLAAVRSPNALGLLEQLAADASPGVRLRAVEMFGGFDPAAVVGPLVRAMLDDADAKVRAGAAATFASFAPSPLLVDELVKGLDETTTQRSTLDATAMASALAPSMTSGFPDGTSLTDHLIRAALSGSEHLAGLVAEVLIACCGNDPADVGALINAFELAHPGNGEALTRLRVEVGGKSALDPILQQLRDDLEAYFQKPIHELNESTRESWQQAVVRARQAFLARMVMSIVVFGLGVVLVVASSVLFLFGDLDTTAAWGAGGTFVGGLTTMLLITYSGPLKDIRQSMSDLGSATVAFIGYVHQVLQISHTFTALYLRDRITYDELDKSSKLLRAATRDTIDALTGTSTTDPSGDQEMRG